MVKIRLFSWPMRVFLTRNSSKVSTVSTSMTYFTIAMMTQAARTTILSYLCGVMLNRMVFSTKSSTQVGTSSYSSTSQL